jgi:hypothetical protein
MNNMKIIKAIVIGGLLLLVSCFVPTVASAIPMADILYLETDLGDGSWQYSYTFYNKSDPLADAGVTLWNIYLDFDASFTLLSGSVPTGWGYDYGPGEVGVTTSFVQSVSSDPAYDVLPGDSLAGFIFCFNAQIGDLVFSAYLFDPNLGEGESVLYSGMTAPAPVPEPATILLMTAGVAGIGLAGRKRTRKS